MKRASGAALLALLFEHGAAVELGPAAGALPVPVLAPAESSTIILPTLAPEAAPTLPSCSWPGKPVYPVRLRRSGNHGLVRAAFTVRRDGWLEDVAFPLSPHPEFERATLDYLLSVRCSPAQRAGLPVPRRVQLEFVFKLTDDGAAAAPDSGSDTFSSMRPASASAPELYRFDVPPKIQVVVAPVYPLELLRQGRHGSAKVWIAVGPDGKVRDSRVVEASDPRFGLATQAAAEAWVFEPARKDGQASWASLGLTEDFNERDRDTGPDRATEELLALLDREAPDFANASELDAPLSVFRRVQPVYPRALDRTGTRGEASIDFYIDRDGQVRLPSILSADRPEFGWAAATAVGRWRYRPPTRDGKPVRVHARLLFDFAPPAAKAEAGPSAPEEPGGGAKPTP